MKADRKKWEKRCRELWAKIIRNSNRCLAKGFGPCSGPLQAAHIYSKKTHRATRFDLQNGVCLCLRHHFLWHADDAWLDEFKAEMFDPDWLQELRRKAKQAVAQVDYEKVYKTLSDEALKLGIKEEW